MKFFTSIIATLGLVSVMSGCVESTPKLQGIDGVGVCNNPKCQCPKPCQCGISCRCGQNNNPSDMSK
jgi:hypothetical protein